MALPRRRLIRPAPEAALPNPQRPRQTQKLRDQLERERTTLARWQKRLRRAFNTVEKCQARIARVDRRLAQLED